MSEGKREFRVARIKQPRCHVCYAEAQFYISQYDRLDDAARNYCRLHAEAMAEMMNEGRSLSQPEENAT